MDRYKRRPEAEPIYFFADPDFRGDPSGCTAVSAIFTEDLKIICVRSAMPVYFLHLTTC